MKTIYIDSTTFECFMIPKDGRIEVRTDVFDGMSDQAIESYRFVPEGYKWVDPDSNESYTGQHVVPIDYGTGGAIREINRRLGNHDTEFTENDSALSDVYAALTELADIISNGGIQNG